MKKLMTILAASVATIGLNAEAAGTASQAFNVTVNLTSACSITAGPTDVAFSYTSFQPGPATAAGGAFSVKCTNNLPYTMALDSTTGTVIGLNYSLSLSAAGGTGNGAAQAYSVGGTMAAGQSGDCAAATCSGSQGRTLTITY